MKWQFQDTGYQAMKNSDPWVMGSKQCKPRDCLGLLPGRSFQILVQGGGEAQQTLWVKEMQLRVQEYQGE